MELQSENGYTGSQDIVVRNPSRSHSQKKLTLDLLLSPPLSRSSGADFRFLESVSIFSDGYGDLEGGSRGG
jgi:hypothetical protein